MASKEIKREDATAEGNIGDGEITAYDQPAISITNLDSPYTKTITLFFREEKHGYTVPRSFAEQVPVLALSLKPDITRLTPMWVGEEIAHTMIHYICTGEYQTLHDPSSKGFAKRQKEYRRSVLAYCTGVGYVMPGLRAHAMRYMKSFDDAVDIQQILALAKEVFFTFKNCLLNSEYPGYIRGKLEGAMEANGDWFKQSDFLQGFGDQSLFDRFMVESMVSVYSKKITSLSNENETLKTVNESLCKDKDKPICPQKPRPTWPQILSVPGIDESAVFPPESAPLFGDDRSGGSSSDAESVDTDGFRSVRKNKAVRTNN